MRHFLLGMLFVFACAAAAPALAQDAFVLSSYNKGIALGCVVDAETHQPLSGASVSLAMAGARNDEYKAAVTTDEKGCYRLPVPMGISSSKVSAKKLLKSSLFSLATNPKGVTDKTKIIYNSIVNIRVEKDGYKAFTGVNQALFGDPAPFEIYLDAVSLAPAAAEYASFLAGDAGSPGFEIISADLPLYFEADVEQSASVVLKLPVGLAPEISVKLNFSDPAGVMYEGGKYEFVLPLAAEGADGTRTYSTKVVARRKNFPREFRVIASIVSGDTQVAQKVYPSVMPGSDREKQGARLFADGMVSAGKGDLAAAEESFKQAIAADPSFKTFYEQLGNVLVDQGRLDDAVAMYETWLAADAKNYNPYVEIAKIYVKQKKYPAALEMLQKVNKLDKKDIITFHMYYEPLYSINQIENGKPVQIDFSRALTMLVKHTDDHAYALALLEKAVAVFPSDSFINYLYGNVLYNLDRGEEALARYEKAVSLDAKNDEARMALGAMYREMGRCDKALAALEAAAAETKEFTIHHLMGLCRLDLGQKDQAVQSFSNAIKFGFSKEFMNKNGQQSDYMNTPFYNEDTYVAGYGDMVFFQGQTRRYYSGFSYDEGKYDFGYIAAQEALGLNPQEAVSLLQSGMMLYSLGLYAQAAADLEKAAALDAGMSQAYKYRCLSYRALGDKQAEAGAMAEYVKMNPFDKAAAAAE